MSARAWYWFEIGIVLVAGYCVLLVDFAVGVAIYRHPVPGFVLLPLALTANAGVVIIWATRPSAQVR